tara:strand:- start:908 stop:2221 length:1314 start_codon:yes stop_codon:yes gene_type:complete
MRFTKKMFALLIIAALTLSCNEKQKVQERPNIIIIMADDLGYGDLSIYGNKKIQTPSIDRLGNEGILMTDFHSNGSVCSPTRAALITGKYQQRVGISGVITAKSHRDKGLSLAEKTFAESAKKAGYKTGIFGKWHLGYDPKFNPIYQGFDEYIGFVSGNVDYHSHVDQEGFEDWWKGSELKIEEGYSTDLISKHAVDFIERNKDESFLLYIAHEAPHYPIQGRKSKATRKVGGDFSPVNKGQNKAELYKEMIEVMDEGIGHVLQTLEKLELDKKTVVFFFSDNGGTKSGSNGSLKGFKGSVWEGGHRVAAMVWSPELIAAGQISNQTLMTMDVYPTIADLIGLEIPKGLDGISFKDHLLSGKKMTERLLFWEFNSSVAIRKNQLKLVINRKEKLPQLFNLEEDIGENNDLANEHPEMVEEMIKQIKIWQKEVAPEAK